MPTQFGSHIQKEYTERNDNKYCQVPFEWADQLLVGRYCTLGNLDFVMWEDPIKVGLPPLEQNSAIKTHQSLMPTKRLHGEERIFS